ncbi:AzlD domain-containing protein [Streptomyces sp. NPDC054771]
MLWLQLYLHLGWTASAITGALLGSLIADGVTGLDFALTAPLTALAVTVGLHLRRRNALLSILGGTTVHVILVSTVMAS